jgi:leucyl aminopeptidase
VLTRTQIAAEGMNGVLAVGVGSREEPRFLVAEHAMAKKNWPLVVIIGKGVTFDSGGISIKPWEKMNEMKSDMAGAASVIATMSMAARPRHPGSSWWRLRRASRTCPTARRSVPAT